MLKQENRGNYSSFGLQGFQHIWECDSCEKPCVLWDRIAFVAMLKQENAGKHSSIVALPEWMESDLDVIMVGTWMLCGNGWSLIWTLSWLAHGCSAGMDGV